MYLEKAFHLQTKITKTYTPNSENESLRLKAVLPKWEGYKRETGGQQNEQKDWLKLHKKCHYAILTHKWAHNPKILIKVFSQNNVIRLTIVAKRANFNAKSK